MSSTHVNVVSKYLNEFELYLTEYELQWFEKKIYGCVINSFCGPDNKLMSRPVWGQFAHPFKTVKNIRTLISPPEPCYRHGIDLLSFHAVAFVSVCSHIREPHLFE